MSGAFGRAGVALAAAAVLSGCVAPAPTTDAYESKAAMTAQAALSAARTAVLATRAHADEQLPAPYLESTLVDAEKAIGSVQATFTSIEPPATDAADRLRSTLDPLLGDAASAVTDMRIAVRRDRPTALSTAAADLAHAADELERFSQEHGP